LIITKEIKIKRKKTMGGNTHSKAHCPEPAEG